MKEVQQKNKSDFYGRLHQSQSWSLPKKTTRTVYKKKTKQNKNTALSGYDPTIYKKIPGSAAPTGLQSNR
jgi:hypothetical protein